MKKLFVKRALIPIMGLILVASACKGGKSTGGKVNMSKPENVAKAFITHLNKFEIDKAKQYGTEDTKKILDLLNQVLDMASEEEKKKIKEEADKAKVENIKCVTTGDKSECNYCCDEKGKEQGPIELKKIDGKWYVHMKKEEPPMEDGHGHDSDH